MRIVKLAVVGVLMIPGWRVADAAKDCTAEKTAGRQAFDEEIAARQKVNAAKNAVKQATFALELARRQAPTYDADLATARANDERYTRDLDECRKRSKNNVCGMQESHKKNAKERLDDLLANPPATRIANAEKRLADAEVELSHAEEAELAAEIVHQDASKRLATCQKTRV